MDLYLNNINITNFRSYDVARITIKPRDSDDNIIIITGANGAGKTNILEAISMLTPGKGLRNADILDMKNKDSAENDTWTISAEIKVNNGLTSKIGTTLDRKNKKRIIRIDGQNTKNQSELSEIISAIWLTPQMDRLFIDGSSARRRFIDRLVFAYEPSHVTRVNRYEKKMRERLKILQSSDYLDKSWLSTIEKQMAAESISIAASRVNLIKHLQQEANKLTITASLFPTPLLSMSGWIEQEIEIIPAVEIEDKLIAKLESSRPIDKESKRTHEGAHKTDLIVTYKEKNMPANQCSTGEQKALLISIILSHSLMMHKEKGFAPLILLDEVAAHLDDERKEELFTVLSHLKSQVFLTGIDKAIFSSLKGHAKFIFIKEGRII